VLTVSLWTSVLIATVSAEATPAVTPLVLLEAQRAAIARVFAPTLLFHPLEEYFPTNSMPLSAYDGLFTAQPEGWPARVERYRSLSATEKLDRASVAYRVFSRVQRGRLEVVVEYWCYYVFNAFTVRGGWLPYRVRDNHPHDLERVYLVLTPTSTPIPIAADGRRSDDDVWARGAFRIRSVIANAHDGSIPPNEYDVSEAQVLTPPLTLLVERGSHAMAPDINDDGRFTPGVDSTGAPKMQWGIRDNGSTWGWYRASFTDRRDASAVRLCGPAIEATEAIDAVDERKRDTPCTRYTLYPADDLQRWFGTFQLSRDDRRAILGRTSLLVRTFGDVRIEKLMVPMDPPDGRMLTAMLRRRGTTEAGYVAGFTTVALSPAVVLGRRYFWRTESRYTPDVLAEALAVFPIGGRRSFEATMWSSYSVDAITNMVFGAGWFSEGDAADVAAGVDLRIGRWRVRPTWRIRENALNARVTTTF
jgi:hypothetical protein